MPRDFPVFTYLSQRSRAHPQKPPTTRRTSKVSAHICIATRFYRLSHYILSMLPATAVIPAPTQQTSPWADEMPTEILESIFLYACQPEWDKIHHIYFPRTPDNCLRWAISQVCSYWRSLIRNMPIFWNDIAQAPKGTDFDTFVGMLQRYLEMNPHLDRISTRFVVPSDSYDAPVASRAPREAFAPFCGMYKSLGLGGKPEALIHWLQLPDGSFRNLRKLSIEVKYRVSRNGPVLPRIGPTDGESHSHRAEAEDDDWRNLTIFSDMPYLENLVILDKNLLPWFPLHACDFPWGNLKRLELLIHELKIPTLLGVLLECRNLDRLKLAVIHPSHDSKLLSTTRRSRYRSPSSAHSDTDEDFPIILPELRSMEISYKREAVIDVLLTSITAPRLEKIVLNGWYLGWLSSTWTTFSISSGLSLLSKLSLSQKISADAILGLIKALPCLQRLFLWGWGVGFGKDAAALITQGIIGKMLQEIVMSADETTPFIQMAKGRADCPILEDEKTVEGSKRRKKRCQALKKERKNEMLNLLDVGPYKITKLTLMLREVHYDAAREKSIEKLKEKGIEVRLTNRVSYD